MKWKVGVGASVAIGILTIVILYGSYYAFLLTGYPPSGELTDLKGVRSGTFGDAFGTLNALFSGLAFSGVLLTLYFQRKDLEENRSQNAKQQTESQFYNMLALQQQVIQGFDLHIERNGVVLKTVQGRDCFRNWRQKLVRRFRRQHNMRLPPGEASMGAYTSVMRSHLGDLGLYYRSLYSVFRFIETANSEQQAHFGVVIRSLLSDYELVFLFYNCLSSKGKKFMSYAIKYALFDNLNIELLLDFDDLLLMPREVYGNNSDALRVLSKLE